MPISRQPSRPHIVLDTIALYMARKAPPRKPNRGEGIVKGVASTKHEEAIASSCFSANYTVSQIKTPMRTIVHNFVKFLQFFDWQTQQEICNIVIIKYPTTPQICHYTTL